MVRSEVRGRQRGQVDPRSIPCFRGRAPFVSEGPQTQRKEREAEEEGTRGPEHAGSSPRGRSGSG